MSYSAMNKRYKDDVKRVYVDLVENIDTALILPHLVSCLHESDMEELRKKIQLNSKRNVNQLLLEKLFTREYWWKSLKNALLEINSVKLVTELGWQIDEIDAEVSHNLQRNKATNKEEPTTSKPVVTRSHNNGCSELCVIQDVEEQKLNVYKNQSNLVKEASLETNKKVVSNDLNANLKESSEAKVEKTKTIDNQDEGKLTIDPNVLPLNANNHGNIAKPVEPTLKEIEPVKQSPPCLKGPSNIPLFHTESSSSSFKSPETIISDRVLRDTNPPVDASVESEIIPKEQGSISTDEIPCLDENIFDGDKSLILNSLSSTSTVDPQGHSANGRMKGEIFIASNKINVTTDLNVVVQDISGVSGANFKESSEAKVEQTTIDNHAVQDIEPPKDEGKLTIDPNVRKYLPLNANNHGNIAKPVEPTLKAIEPVQQSPPCLKGPSNIPLFHTESSLSPETIISDRVLRDTNPPVDASVESDVQECSLFEIIPKEPGSISTDEIPSLDENIFDGDNSLNMNSFSSTSTVDPQGHSANGKLKGEIFIASNKMNVTTEPRFETEERMVSPYVTTLHGSFTDSESVDSQDIRSGCSDQQLYQQQVLCFGNTSNPEIVTDFEHSTEAPLDIQQTQASQSSDGTRAQSHCLSQEQEGSNVYPPALSDLDSAAHPVVNSVPDQSSTIRSLGSSAMDSHIFYPPSLSEQRTGQSASLSGLDPPEGCNQSDIPALSIFQEYSPPAPISQDVPLVLPSERQEDRIDLNSSVVQESDLNSAAHPVVNSDPDSDIFYPPSLSEQRTDQSASQSGRYPPEGCQEDLIDLNSSVERTENMQDLMRHVDDPILEPSGLQAQNRESNPPSLTECAILTAAQAFYSLTR